MDGLSIVPVAALHFVLIIFSNGSNEEENVNDPD